MIDQGATASIDGSQRVVPLGVVATISVGLAVVERFIDSPVLLRASQLVPLVGLLFVGRLRRREAVALLAAGSLTVLFAVHLVVFQTLQFAGFYPAAIVGAGILFSRVVQLWPRKTASVAAVLLSIVCALLLVRSLGMGVHPNDLLVGSRNQLLTLVLALTAFAIASAYVAYRPGTLARAIAVPLLLALVTVFLLTGRMGFAVALLLGLLYLMTALKFNRVIVLAVPLAVALYFEHISNFVRNRSGPRTGLEDFQDGVFMHDVRFEVWGTLWERALQQQHWTGFPPGATQDWVGITSHSSYIDIVSSTGIPGLAIVAISLTALVVDTFRRSPLMAVLVLILCFRALTDDALYGMLMGPALVFSWLASVSSPRSGRCDPRRRSEEVHARDAESLRGF